MNIPTIGFFSPDLTIHPNPTPSKPNQKRKIEDNGKEEDTPVTQKRFLSRRSHSPEIPSDILYQIFKRYARMDTTWQDIGRLAKACKKFFCIMTSPSLIREFLAKGNATQLGMTSRLAVKIAALYCREVPKLRFHFDKASIPRATHLMTLGKCKGVHSLSLSSEHVNDDHLARATKKMPHLQEFGNYYCEQLTPWGLFKLADHCTHLTKLVWKSDQAIPQNVVLHLSEQFTRLQQFTCIMGELTDLELAKISEGCPNLHALKVYQLDVGITDRAIEDIAARCTKLKKLSLSSPGFHTDQTFRLLGQHCTDLTALKLDDSETTATDQGLQYLSSRCTKLQTLWLQWKVPVITDEAASALSKNCPMLTKLILINTFIGDKGLFALAKSCPKLAHLCLAHSQITDEGLIEFAQSLGNRLISIDLSYCQNIIGNGIAKLASSCPNLTLINLIGCQNITLRALKKLFAVQFNSQTIINLSYCNKLTKKLVEHYQASNPTILIISHF